MKERICKVEGCNRKRRSKGYCKKHYQQIFKHGKILEDKRYSKFRVEGENVYIELCNKKYEVVGEAIIDIEDLDKIKGYRFHKTNRGYVRGNTKEYKYLHHLIIGKPPKGFVTDHKDRNKLNNKRNNLRFITNQQNIMNSNKRKNTSSKYKGVCFVKAKKKWIAQISFNKKIYRLGCFANEKEAAKAYNKKAIEFFGEFAALNDL